MRVMAIVNRKGGCGRTTVAINLSACLARLGRRVLLIDMDPQSHCAAGLAVPSEQVGASVADLLAPAQGDPIDWNQVIWKIGANFDLAPSKPSLVRLERFLEDDSEAEERLSQVLAVVSPSYDIAVIDCPASIGGLTRGALRAAREIVIPADTGFFGLHGLDQQIKMLEDFSRALSAGWTLHVVPNLYDVRTKLAREIVVEIRRRFPDHVTTTLINFNAKLREAAGLGQPITEYDPASMGCKDFLALARELDFQPRATAPVAEADMPEALRVRADKLAADAERLLAATSPQGGNGREPAARGAAERRSLHGEIASAVAKAYGVRFRNDGVVFCTHAPGAREVQIAGEFNDWRPQLTPMSPAGAAGDFETVLALPPGRYRYRLVVDGRWQPDVYNSETAPNAEGELESVVQVPNVDDSRRLS